MAWQDEVRRLDEELAAGRLSADEHQRRRDELTAQGGEQATPADQQNPAAQPNTGAQPNAPAQPDTGAQPDTAGQQGPPPQNPPAQADAPAQASPGQGSPGQGGGTPGQGGQAADQEAQHSPFPPAFRWDNTPNETTQVISPVGNADAERTQVVPAPEQPGPAYDDSERTQVVQAGPPAPPRFGAPSYSGGGGYPGADDPWAQQESAPPWVASEPIQEPNAGWMMQGPESFEAEPKDTGATMRIVAVAAAVVVLLAVGVGAYFLFQPGSDDTADDDRTTAAEPPPPAPAPPPGDAPQEPAPQPQGPPVAALPGEQLDTSEFRDFAQVRQLGYFTEGELETMYAAGPSDAALALSTQGDNKLIILVVKAADAEAARDGLADLQLQFELDEQTGAPAGVRVAGSDDVSSGDPVLRRAHYASGEYLVRVQVSGTSVSDVDQLFEEILTTQQQELPADG